MASLLAALAAVGAVAAAAEASAGLVERFRSGRTNRVSAAGAPHVLAIGIRLARTAANALPLGALPRRRGVQLRLECAGLGWVGQRDWLALKTAGAFVAAPITILVASGASSRLAPLVIVAGSGAGFLAPDFWLARRGRLRIEAALRDLPDMLDLLRVAVAAGMPPPRALGLVAARFPGTLASEWGRVAALVSLGVSQDEALASLRERLPHERITALVQALGRSREHGVPLGRALAALAARARHAQQQRVRESAAKAGPKIQLAVALLLVPSVLLMVAAALVAELERSGLGLAG